MAGKKSVKITETIFRDAHQSLLATRMSTDDMLPIAEKIDKAGFHSVEMWGGATFDSAMRYLNEDPWERVKKLKEKMPNTSFQMLLRGQNIVGYKHYPDDAVREFVRLSIKNGVDIFRIFDALNDVRNMQASIEATKEFGAHAQATVVYTTSPVHDIEHYRETAKELQKAGADSICIKDMAGLLRPYEAEKLVKVLKKELDIPVQLHTHYTSGLGSMTYLKAVEAGVDVIDTALSTLALGTSQPATETMVAAFEGTEYDTGIGLEYVSEINKYFKDIRGKLKDNMAPKDVDPEVLIYQIPGGMLSNMRSQMKKMNMLERLLDTLLEVPKVRKDLGYPPLVTPMSQIVGTQAVFNVATGKRYNVVSKEVKDYLKGYYGKAPGEIDPDFRAEIIGKDAELIDHRPADDLEPLVEKTKNELQEKGYYRKEEDILSYILFPPVAEEFFKSRE
ncbi:MAG TPA: pyruvate carboxylase subunit B [Halanaerobiales bacterium]|nr:pyruvate carboxylase subunit B [Halanaerobiales bacterium]